MRRYEIASFGSKLVEVEYPRPTPAADEVLFAPTALSLNYRDHLVIAGSYNPRLELPAVPVSDAAGQVLAVGEAVEGIEVGQRMLTNFVCDWNDGGFRREYLGSTLGTPGPGLACEGLCLPPRALVPIPPGIDDASAACLPIAALTAYSVLVREANVGPSSTVLTLGTGGVSIFALQIAKALGAQVIITSSSEEKLARARELGADLGINYAQEAKWHRHVLKATDGLGADVVVETGGIGTLQNSLAAVRAGGVVGLLGALTGLKGELDIGPILMKRIRVAGVMVDAREGLLDLLRLVQDHRIKPVISRRFGFSELPEALAELARGQHFGKIVVER